MSAVKELCAVIGGVVDEDERAFGYTDAVDFVRALIEACTTRNRPVSKALMQSKKAIKGVDESLLTTLFKMLFVFMQPLAKNSSHDRRIEDDLRNTLVNSGVSRLLYTTFTNESAFDISLRLELYISLVDLLKCVQPNTKLFGALMTWKPKDGSLGLVSRLSSTADVVSQYLESLKELKAVVTGVDLRDERMKQLHGSLQELVAKERIPHELPGNLTRVTRCGYADPMKALQFDSVPFTQVDANNNHALAVPYFFSKSLTTTSLGLDQRTRRLAQEISALRAGLPLSEKGSVFVRVAEERLDALKVLMIGPTGTPYANGCFVFDVHVPSDYPNSPPLVQLMTTGNGKVRFNPNLYACGKVCLSLLNTWFGTGCERWSASSSLLQVFVSIHSLIMVEEPYFNEPGFGSYRGTANGQKASRKYIEGIRSNAAYWAMLDTFRNPPKPFEDVVRVHFFLKTSEIIVRLENWLKEEWTLTDHKKSLQTTFDALKRELAMIKKPQHLKRP